MADTYYGTAGADADAGLAKILQATKLAGKAGQDAYNEARTGIDSRQKEALGLAAKQDAFLGGGATQFTDRTNAQNNRFLNALDTARSGYTQGLEGTAASATSYMTKLKAALPALQAANAKQLSSHEASLAARQAGAKKKNEETKIMGETQAELDALLAERTKLEGEDLPKAKATDESWQPGGFNAKPIEDQIAANNKRLNTLNQIFAKVPSYIKDEKQQLEVLRSRGVKNPEALLAEGHHLEERNRRFQDALDKQRGVGAYDPSKAIDPGAAMRGAAPGTHPVGPGGSVRAAQTPAQRLAELNTRIAQLQATQKSPAEISQAIATNKYGWDPDLARGTFTNAKWNPLIAANDKATSTVSPLAASIAAKGEVLISPEAVQTVLDDENVQKDLMGFQAKAVEGGVTFSDVDAALREEYLDQNSKSYNPDAYQVLKAQLRGWGWAKEKK